MRIYELINRNNRPDLFVVKDEDIKDAQFISQVTNLKEMPAILYTYKKTKEGTLYGSRFIRHADDYSELSDGYKYLCKEVIESNEIPKPKVGDVR